MNIVEEYNKINTPEELQSFMDKHIKYGFNSNDGKKYINDGSAESDKIFQEACLTQYGLANKDKVLKLCFN